MAILGFKNLIFDLVSKISFFINGSVRVKGDSLGYVLGTLGWL